MNPPRKIGEGKGGAKGNGGEQRGTNRGKGKQRGEGGRGTYEEGYMKRLEMRTTKRGSKRDMRKY